MRHSRYLRTLLVSLGLIGWSALSSEAQADVTVQVSRTLRPGTQLQVTASGFAPGETVGISLDGTAAVIGTVTADASGALSASPTVPASTRPGEHLLVLSGQTSGEEVSSAFKVSTPWGQYGYRQTNTHYNPHENIINPGNVSQLQRVWRTRNTGKGEVVVGSGRLFAQDGEAHSLANGRFLWRSDAGSPAAVYGQLYGVSTVGALLAVPQNCAADASGVCAPAWSSTLSGNLAKVSVDNNRIYIARNGIEVYDTSCSTGTCSPRWRSARGFGKPLVSNGVVYVRETGSEIGDTSAVIAYPVDCRSDGGFCSPLWELPLPGRIFDELVIAEGRLFVTVEFNLAVYRENCGALPGGCQVLWRVQEVLEEPSVANGVVYASAQAYSTDCRRDGGICTELWRYAGVGGGPLTVAGGLIWGAASSGAETEFIAAAPAVCPVGSVCQPLWYSPPTASPSTLNGSVVVSDGMVFASSNDNKVYAYGLPASAGGVATGP